MIIRNDKEPNINVVRLKIETTVYRKKGHTEGCRGTEVRQKNVSTTGDLNPGKD